MENTTKPREVGKRSLPIRLWFEFYKLALQNPDLTNEIKSSAKFYESWGDVFERPFNLWYMWKVHSFLNKNKDTVKIVKPPINTSENGYVYVAIPLSCSITDSAKAMMRIVSDLPEYTKSDQKRKNVIERDFNLTEGKELKLDSLRIYLKVYKLYRKLGKPPINRKFIDAIHQAYRSRNAKIPPSLGIEGNLVNEDSVLRTIRRYIQKAKLLEKNAAKGDFPGKDYTD